MNIISNGLKFVSALINSVPGYVLLGIILFAVAVGAFFVYLAAEVRTPIEYQASTIAVVAFWMSGLAFLGAVIRAIVNQVNTIRKRRVAAVESARERAKEKPDTIKPTWEMGRATLEEYFDRNLQQINLIFILSISVMFIGFGLILYGIFIAFSIDERKTTGDTITLVSAAAGIVTEFIGATFLFMYRSTIKQAVEYTQALERINSVGMAMQILDTISGRETEEAKGQLVEAKISISKLLLTRFNTVESSKFESIE